MAGDWLKRMDSALAGRREPHGAERPADGQRARASIPAPPPPPDDAQSAPMRSPPLSAQAPVAEPAMPATPAASPRPAIPLPASHSPVPPPPVAVEPAPVSPAPPAPHPVSPLPAVAPQAPTAERAPVAAPPRPSRGRAASPAATPVEPPRHVESAARTAAAKNAVQIAFASWLAYKLEVGTELRMVPRQWELVDYFGDGSWELRRFPFGSLQSIALQGESALPRLEVRIAPDGRDEAEVLLVFAAYRSGDLESPRACLLHAGPFTELEGAMKAILPAFLSLWARCSAGGDFSPLYDWALENDKAAEQDGA